MICGFSSQALTNNDSEPQSYVLSSKLLVFLPNNLSLT